MKVIVGLSGGVDSAVSAYLLKQQGADIEAVFMKNWEGDDRFENCPAEQDIRDAKAVADQLSIPFHVVNFSKSYWNKVFEHFLAEYAKGRTPNPDVLCNKEIKFKAFLDYALTLGADKIATGHYARLSQDQTGYHLQKGLDTNKDQSYFLHLLTQTQLSRALFPVGELTKPQVRQIATEQGFINAAKKDSTGICFIGERHFKSFLQEFLPAKPGNIETITGELIGRHEGLMYYTIGQRKGLQIGGVSHHPEAAWYVVKKDLVRNVLVIAQGENHPALFQQALTVSDQHWINAKPSCFPFSCETKIRYRQLEQPSLLHADGTLEFVTPQRAITPGQYAVFYQGSECLGGGVIN